MTDNLIFPGQETFDKEAEIEIKQVHIRIQQRNKGKCLTLVEGLDEKWDPNPEKILKYLRKALATNGTLLKGEKGKVLQLQGDHRQKMHDFLIANKLCESNQIKIHGG